MADFLNLKHLRVVAHEDKLDHYLVLAEGRVKPLECPFCKGPLNKFGRLSQAYMDTPMHGKRVLINIDRQRFRCVLCRKTLSEPLPDIDGKRQATSRLIRYIEERCLKETFLSLAREVGVDDKTVRFIFDDMVQRLENQIQFETPAVLGIDEIHILDEYRAVLTNIEKLSMYDMRPTRKKVDLSEYFTKMPNKENVQVVVMDMWSTYRDLAQKHFPGRPIVVDKFHVVRMANEAVEKVRKRVRKSLDNKMRLKLKNERFVLLKRHHDLTEADKKNLVKWTELFPDLGVAYSLKERFFDVYTASDRGTAERIAEEWLQSIPKDVDHDFKKLATALQNWWTHIFNYFEYPVTNAYTESANNLARSINRMARGYSFDVIRAKLIYDETARKDTRTSIRKKKGKDKNVAKTDTNTDAIGYVRLNDLEIPQVEIVEEKVVEYGPYIPTLVRLLEEGYFS